MFLKDYQLKIHRKIERGGNYIVNFPRRWGMSNMLLSSALLQLSKSRKNRALMLFHNFDCANTNQRSVFDFIRTTYSSFDVTQSMRGITSFNNGTILEFDKFSNGKENPKVYSKYKDDPPVELIIVDQVNDDFYFLLESFPKAQFVIGYTGSIDVGTPLYNFCIKAQRGEVDFDDIRIFPEVDMELYRDVGKSYSIYPEKWVKDVYLLPLIP